MNTKTLIQSNTVDLGKRQTLKGVSQLAAAGALFAAMPAYAQAAHTLNSSSDTFQDLSSTDLQAILVSIPDKEGESLILQNSTNKDITIGRFYNRSLMFDGELVNCNDACTDSAIEIPANSKTLVQFKSPAIKKSVVLDNQHLNVQSHVQRLPQGTRYIRLGIHMIGDTANVSIAKLSTAVV